MSALGVHFAVTPAQAKKLLAARSDRTLMGLIEGLEEAWAKHFVVESDKAWGPIHRCLTDGSLLYESGEYPLNHCICGGRQLHRGDDYTVSFVTAAETRDVAAALAKVTKPWMRRRYHLIDPKEYPERSDEDFDSYVWVNFLDIRRFFKRAAASRRAVVFTADC